MLEKMNIVKSKTLEEYMAIYGVDYDNGDLWDFAIEDFENGAVEPQEDLVYWEIDGRLYETKEM